MPIVKCKYCNSEFYAKPNWLIKGWGKFCSQKCNHENQKNGDIFNCSICGKKVYRSKKPQSRSISGKYFCSKSCQTVWRNSVVYKGEMHPNWKSGVNVYREILKRADVVKKCSRCNNDDPRVLSVHHIDSNRQNNKLYNLAWLCYNCHFLVHHYPKETKGLLKSSVTNKYT